MNRANRQTTMLRAPSSRGITLVEVLVVIAVIVLLICLGVLTVNMARESARRADCSSRMRQVALAVEAYSTANGNAIPVGIYGKTRHTGQTLLTPHFESSNLFKSGFGNSATEFGTTAANSPGRLIRLPIFICPSDNPGGTGTPTGETSSFARSNFVLCFGSDETLDQIALGGIFQFNVSSSFAIVQADGASNTTMISEVISGKDTSDAAGMWAYGGGGSSAYTHALLPTNTFDAAESVTGSASDLSGAKGRASSNHSGLVNVVFADMHATQIATGIDPAAWQAAGTASGTGVFAAPN